MDSNLEIICVTNPELLRLLLRRRHFEELSQSIQEHLEGQIAHSAFVFNVGVGISGSHRGFVIGSRAAIGYGRFALKEPRSEVAPRWNGSALKFSYG